MAWQAFAVLYKLGITAYAIGAKLAAGKISTALGAFVMTACSLSVIAVALIYFHFNNTQFTFNRYGLAAAAFAGIAIAVADIALFFMYARGAELSVAAALTEVIAVALIALVGFILLKEPLTLTKALGLLFAGISVFLLFRS